MPIIGSSYVRKTVIEKLVGYTGPTGPTGITGATGATGATGYGATGATGFSITGITKQNNLLITTFQDGTILQSSSIKGPTGKYHLHATGLSLDTSYVGFLKTVQENTTFIDPTTSEGYSADIFNFRNIKSGSPEIVITDNGDLITVAYDLVDISALGLAGGPLNSLVKNNPGDFQSGYTGTSYDSESSTVFSVFSDVREKIVAKNATLRNEGTVQVWALDPNTEGTALYLAGQKTTAAVSESWVVLKSPNNPSYSRSTLVVSPPITKYDKPVRFFYTSDNISSPTTIQNLSPIVWPLGDVPCFSGKYDLFNFISVGNVWYGYVISYNQTTPAAGSTLDNVNDRDTIYQCHPSQLTFRSLSFAGITHGICCDKNCGYTFSTNTDCDGFFVSGYTYSAGLTLCDSLGACCLSTKSKQFLECKELKYCECATIAEESNLVFNWSKFSGLKRSCEEFDCKQMFVKVGACCDGSGGCSEVSEVDCDGYWQGAGIKCNTSQAVNVCYYGNGACCNSGVTCDNGVDGDDCFSSNRTYFGDGSSCKDINCSRKNIPCFSIISDRFLSVGDEYSNGIVVGIFDPNASDCFGSDIFERGKVYSFSTLTSSGGETAAAHFKSVYDYTGYGFTGTNICDNETDSYLMLVSKHPITIDESGNVIDYNGDAFNTTEFIWSSGGNSWGPLYNITPFKIDDPDFGDLNLFEGYLYKYGVTGSQNNLAINSFPSCNMVRSNEDPEEWLNLKPNSGFNGKWYRNYGFLNTARMINAEYTHYYGITGSGIYDTSYTPRVSTEYITASRAVSHYNEKYPESTSIVSDWFIPSHDELAFIANACVGEENLNLKIIGAGGTPLDGWHWTSTGTFKDSSTEGILSYPDGLTHGSYAWAIKFNSDSVEENFLVAKKERTTNYYKVRPIKMIRCDGSTHSGNIDFDKYWRLLKINKKVVDNS